MGGFCRVKNHSLFADIRKQAGTGYRYRAVIGRDLSQNDMEMKLSENRIVRVLAESVCQRIARKTIRALQRMTTQDELLSGEDSGLTNVWEEICVQLQQEESFSWGAYKETIRVFVGYYIDEMSNHERKAVWLQTPEGEDWDSELDEEREPYPVFNGDITNYIVYDYVLSKGNDWTNPRIRAFLYRRYLD